MSRNDVNRFYASLSGRARVKLYAAIFFLLAPVGLLASWRPHEERTPWTIAAHVVLSGLGGVGAAAAFIHNLRFLLVVVPVHGLSYMMLERFNPSLPGAIGAVGIGLIALGYIFFISFVSGEGVSKLMFQTEIALAQDIHRDLVPAINFTGARFALYGRSMPSSAVGGDLIDEDRAAYANAGHLPLLRYDARSGRVERLPESGLPLGAGVRPRGNVTVPYEWHAFEFLAGDLLILLTDGLTEVRDRAGEELGLDPFEALVLRDPQAPLSTLCERISFAARNHGSQVDDQTVLLVRRLGS